MACEKPTLMLNPRYRGLTDHEIAEYAHEVYGTGWPPDWKVEIPCGYCHGCQKTRMNGYRLRLLFEVAEHQRNIFITLTFDDENLKKFKDDYNRAVRLFLDRVRKRFGKQVRHWFCSEYGTEKGRIHYHGILFGFSRWSDYDEWRELWSYGHIWLGWVEPKTASYITKYLTKDLCDGKPLPRIITSKGIGAGYLTPERIRWHRNPGGTPRPYLSVNGYKQALPRYWYNKIFTDADKANMALENFLNPPTRIVEGVEYKSRREAFEALRKLHNKRLATGLSKLEKPPALPVKRGDKLNKFKELISKNYGKEFQITP